MVAIVAQRKEGDVQIVHVTKGAITAMTVLFQSYCWLGQPCFRITSRRHDSTIKLDFARESDVALAVDAQTVLVINKAAVSAFAGKLFHFNTDSSEFC
jgi:hypothetical protein